MFLTIASWNIAGASLLTTTAEKRAEQHKLYNAQINKLIKKSDPDIILLQEVIRYGTSTGKIKEIINCPKGYYYLASTTIDTLKNGYPLKWDKIRRRGQWANKTYMGVGLAILWKKDIKHSSLWSTRSRHLKTGPRLEKEEVRIETGLFTGNRDTEPRMAVVSHFNILNRDFYIINLHLTTLKGEREGFPEKDNQGSLFRQEQVNTILNGIVSRLNADQHQRSSHLKKKVLPGIWILGGDFNATPEAPEISKIQQMNFTRLCSDAPTKRSKKGTKPIIKVDYFFAGPCHYAFDPDKLSKKTSHYTIDYELNISDHYPIITRFPVS
ncbi:MAG: endonuclease/exonuclease/phosphatase family protein [Thiotrichaceae bacterium]|nr:endonuclease/exonuclease/phosphatase family protein [Thiotrichaceae bacterium]